MAALPLFFDLKLCMAKYSMKPSSCRTRRIAAQLAVTLFILLLPAAGLRLRDGSWARCLAFPPRPPEVAPAPFSWPHFIALALLIVLPLAALVRLGWRGARHLPPPTPPTRCPLPRWGWAALTSGGAAWALAWTRCDAFAGLQPYTFLPLWLAYIAVLNALTVKRGGRSPLLAQPGRYLLLFPLSAAFWWLFEWLNRAVQNWSYEGVEGWSGGRYALVATLSFATVLPAFSATAAWLETYPRLTAGFAAGSPWRPRHPRRLALLVLALGSAVLAALPLHPEALFPFVWLAPPAMLAAAARLAAPPGTTGDSPRGDWRAPVRNALAALVCGFFWEMWNMWSLARWVYAVPYVNRFHLFEMPLLGYAGYLPFGLACGLVAGWLMNEENRKTP